MLRKYKDDYETVITHDESGREKKEVVYRGVHFELNLDEKGLTRFKRNSLLLLILIVVLHLSAGYVNNPGMYSFFIAVPYVIVFWPLWNITTGVLNIPKAKARYRRDEVELSFKRMDNAGRALLIFLGIELLVEILFIIFFSTGGVGKELLFFLPEGIAAAVAYLFFRLQKQIQVQKLNEKQAGD